MDAPRSRRLLTLAAAAAAVLALVVPATAMTGPTSYATSIFMSQKFPAFHGRLHSKSDFCVANRPVKVYRERPGPDKLLGTDRSEDIGTWAVPIGNKLISGIYYTTASRYGSASLGIVCRPARSEVAVVD
jgi:hypothetical protein